jgi:hypothetical protein|tara:strand:+ start:1612 stop:1971 length:360 start_codon:yes stop_codon:yes gene_type:complete
MSISDVQNELNSIKKDSTIETNNSINEILNKNVSKLEDYMNSKVVNIYSRPWNKLEPRLKRNRMNLYLTCLLNEKKIELNIFNALLYKLSKEIEFNKKITVDYDTEKCEITSFNYDNYL